MKHRPLGQTGIQLSELGLGTLQFGMPYGLPDEKARILEIPEYDALTLIHLALDRGITFLETGRYYGNSEQIVGRAIKKRQESLVIATVLDPLDPAMTDEEMRKTIKSSIENSRRALDRETLDLLQLDIRTPQLLKREVITESLMQAQSRDRVHLTGLISWHPDTVERMLEQGMWNTVQLAYHVLDQSAAPLIKAAAQNQLGILVHSPFLMGVIPHSPETLPPSLQPLNHRAQQFKQAMDLTQISMAQAALLFLLSQPEITTIIMGVQTPSQLLENLGAPALPHLTAEQLAEAKTFHWSPPEMLDPQQWNLQGVVR